MALLVGLAGATLFIFLAVVRLGDAPTHYDELYQAPAAFWHIGQPCTLLCSESIATVPVLTISYAGAIKSHLYGLVLRARGRFELLDWRWTGLAPVAAGLVLLPLLLRRWLGPGASALLVALVASDVTLLLLARHDFGPVAIAFLLRVLFLRLALWRIASDGTDCRGAFALGLVAGLSIYEKLSNLALLPPLLLALALDRSRQARFRSGVGLTFGLLPLLLANLTHWWRTGELVSARHVVGLAGSGGAKPLLETLALGLGGRVAEEQLGLARPVRLEAAEGVLMTVLLCAIAVTSWRAWAGYLPGGEAARRAGICAFFAAAGVSATWCLPRATAPWHWIVVTPALGTAVAFMLESARSRSRTAAGLIVLAVGTMLGLRTSRALEIRTALIEGRSTTHWSRGVDEFARQAAAVGDSELFVATDWGIAPQLYCFANGRRRHVVETAFRSDGAMHALIVATRWHKELVHLVRPRAPGPLDSERAAEVERAFAASREWREEPPRESWRALDAVSVRSFRRVVHERQVGVEGAASVDSRAALVRRRSLRRASERREPWRPTLQSCRAQVALRTIYSTAPGSAR